MTVVGRADTDRRSLVPRDRLYRQVEAHLLAMVADLQAGMSIPSERELTASLGVSRTTVRLAIGRLVGDGVLSRSHGSGTFVSRPKIRQRLVALRGFTADIEASGQRPGARLVQRGMVPATAQIAADLALTEGAAVIYLERVRTVDDVPLLINRAHYQPAFTSVLHADVENRSVWDLLMREHDVCIVRGVQTIDVVAVGARDAGLLGERPGALAVRLQMVTYDRDGRPVESIESLYRAGLSSFSMELFSEPCEGHGSSGESDRSASMRGDAKEDGKG